MDPLLHLVLDAHGGITRWHQFSDFVTDVQIVSHFAGSLGTEALLPSCRLLLSMRAMRTIAILPDDQGQLVIQPDVLSHRNIKGTTLEQIRLPGDYEYNRAIYESSQRLRTGYVTGFVIRPALLGPFLYAGHGFVAEEVQPWYEDGELWRVLKLSFPDTHRHPYQTQYAYYGEDGLLRRTRNAAPMLGLTHEVVNYVMGYEEIDGIKIPTSRQIFECDREGNKSKSGPIAEIHFSNCFFTD